jgi:branched-chain amino acid transport system ATP-binding protein
MALALQPRLLLLDEPTAGVGTEEANSLVELVQSVWMNTPGLSVLFISHDIRIVFNVARRIIFMRGGAVVFDGPPEDARESERLRSLYLGEEI